MPNNDVRAHLAAIYAASDDPWNTRSSRYEQGKFAQTIASLPKPRYRFGLEVGCGAGALTAHLTQRCDDLHAMDCTDGALRVARAHNTGRHITFIAGAAPRDWPTTPPDLVMLSEVLYFMTDAESAGLAARLAQDCASECHVVLVNWLGDTGGGISGAAAAQRLIGQLSTTHSLITACSFAGFRIDILGLNTSRTVLLENIHASPVCAG